MAIGHHARGRGPRPVAEGRERGGAAGVEDADGRVETDAAAGDRRGGRPTARPRIASRIRISAPRNRPSTLDDDGGSNGLFLLQTLVATTGWSTGVSSTGVAFGRRTTRFRFQSSFFFIVSTKFRTAGAQSGARSSSTSVLYSSGQDEIHSLNLIGVILFSQ